MIDREVAILELEDRPGEVCPLSMIGGKPFLCEHACAHCIPESIEEMASNLGYLECLNLPNDMFGNGCAESGLTAVASSIYALSHSVEARDVE